MTHNNPNDFEHYKKVVKDSGLVEDDQLHSVLSELELEHGTEPGDSTILADRLVELELVTPWQNQHLLEGRHKGFFLGRYKLLGHLGSGGMSTVYLAEHTHMRRKVAIKVLAEVGDKNSSKVSRFYRECQAIAALDHPNIVRAHDFDSDGKFHYLVMEYIDGPDLQRHVEANGPLDYETAIEYIRQAALGLEQAHKGGMIHRDIKPANLLLDKSGTIKILDMGVAKIADKQGHSLTVEQGIDLVGTVDYLAPEQALDSHEVDQRADIYSLGCTLYFLLTGKPPYPTGSQAQRLLKHQMAPPPNLLKDRADAPRSLIAIMEKMMAKDPNERYQTAEDVQRAAQAWLNGEEPPADNTPSVVEQETAQKTIQPGDSKADTWAGSDQATLMEGAAGQRIQFPCPRCGASIKAPANSAGRRGKCPKCQCKVIVPNRDALGRVELLHDVMQNLLNAARNEDNDWFHALVAELPLAKYELWFNKVFGDELGGRLSEEYRNSLPKLEASLKHFFGRMVARQKDEVRVQRIERAAADVHPSINRALESMIEPAVLYSVRFAAPGESAGGGIALTSFVFAKDAFRFLGPMRVLEVD